MTCRAAWTLRDTRPQLEKLLSDYPVEVTFGEHRFVFSSIEQVDAVTELPPRDPCPHCGVKGEWR